MATYSVHDAGVRQARRLIDDGKYDATTEWSGAAPSADDENRGSRSSTRSPKTARRDGMQRRRAATWSRQLSGQPVRRRFPADPLTPGMPGTLDNRQLGSLWLASHLSIRSTSAGSNTRSATSRARP